MTGHPGGDAHTRRLIDLAGFPAQGRVLDMGAGDGSAVELLEALGFSAQGIDLEPRGPKVARGDFLAPPYPDASFHGILSQCSFWVSGDVPGAISQAARLLRPGGILAFSDVTQEIPALTEQLENAGLLILHMEELTRQWRQYYLHWLWTTDQPCIPVKGSTSYILAVCRKP